MTKKEAKQMRIDNLTYKLSHFAMQRKELYDKLWLLEDEAEKLRIELLKLLTARDIDDRSEARRCIK